MVGFRRPGNSSRGPSLPRYQLLQPVTQMVCGIAAFMASLYSLVAASVGATARIEPSRSRSIHHIA
ncbi:hypothetical protein AWC23_04750 [Mycobacterium saskatchewanense]|uniref:Uncharacterized protein n=1 Tax=Mycobacterium saskatchewanense TaxID=220927 RepID=A0AAJ3NTW5_9MYCO|nr:hypothetical protein AWC23_04750 [Mycobacterium saskatchewanense]